MCFFNYTCTNTVNFSNYVLKCFDKSDKIICLVKYTKLENRSKVRWRSGESTRLPPMWPGFDPRTRRHMWVEFVVGSRPCSERFFSGYSGFPLSSKTNISKFPFDLESVPN